MAPLHLHELGGFCNAPCYLIFLRLVMLDQLVGLEVEDTVKSGINRLGPV